MKKRIPVWLVIIIAFACLAVGMIAIKLLNEPPSAKSGGNSIVNEAPITQISVDDAKKIALEKAGLAESDVMFERTEKDYEKGKLVYEIEFRQGRTEYSAEISADDGKILSWEVDND